MTGRSAPSSWLLTDEPHRIGSGWVSGVLGAVLGLTGLGASCCLAWPDALTTPALRTHWPLSLPTWTAAALLAAAAFGALSLALRRKKTLGLVALAAAALGAALLVALPHRPLGGGPSVVAVDALVLNLLLYPLVFLPLERLSPLRDQPTFRPEWPTDLAWFVASAVSVQITTALVLAPGNALASALPAARATVSALPLPLQFLLAVLVADLAQYWIHRACHRWPWLWRFHAIHHSATAMDWLAGSRLHVVDALLTRALVYAAIAALGFDLAAIAAYLAFVAAQATFVHANVRWDLRWLEPWLVTPRIHHWHHADELPDGNFAVHLPWIDRLFGTLRSPPEGWPARYGLAGGAVGPRGFWRQLLAARPSSA
ncbi:MAG: sterol desaturase family protein [Planctomycetes bacterium]|nr:sterol desaturase family protein [Planctomycetota bacterium]